MLIRTRQCAACPWKRSTVPERDIPNGYDVDKHAALERTLAPGFEGFTRPELRVMACHESAEGRDQPCVGWLAHELGPGNNIALRLVMRDKCTGPLQLDGPQHVTFEDTLPRSAKKKRGRK